MVVYGHARVRVPSLPPFTMRIADYIPIRRNLWIFPRSGVTQLMMNQGMTVLDMKPYNAKMRPYRDRIRIELMENELQEYYVDSHVD